MSGGKPGRIRADKAAGIAEVRAEDGRHVGMAILVTPRRLVTAAHVVNVALGLDPGSKGQPPADSRLIVAFPLLPDEVIADGHVIVWRPMGVSPQDDLAVIELADVASAEAGLARLADITGIGMDDDSLSVFGIAGGNVMGNHVSARFRGFNTDAWIQVEGDRGEDVFAPGGFSGGAVWSNQHAACIGMLVRRARNDTDRFAYMIPAADIAAFWSDLPIERRPLSVSFMRGFTVLSVVFFTLVLIHWLADRGVDLFQAASFGPNKLLSTFFGMQIFAVLAPILFYMLLVFARAYSLHAWWQRVPSFGDVSSRFPMSCSSGRTATLTLVLLVLLPIVAQGHFLKKFSREGRSISTNLIFPISSLHPMNAQRQELARCPFAFTREAGCDLPLTRTEVGGRFSITIIIMAICEARTTTRHPSPSSQFSSLSRFMV